MRRVRARKPPRIPDADGRRKGFNDQDTDHSAQRPHRCQSLYDLIDRRQLSLFLLWRRQRTLERNYDNDLGSACMILQKFYPQNRN